ncbi:glycosyltransferase family 2 protein [Amphritea japonica]|uniref:Glycosyl transferase family 2 n=1 Tax=Amphritea japonica ATCC BAA-1530 TaxID=1278309 RepID=A0A7R6PFI0_9GAMM|nr:glycosyltransferase [Amphritea japonica]BBB25497.1 glycosyl transferase family 2 [Amphritea japonica ATCC BAA-1530]
MNNISLSVVVIFHEMQREAERTLYSLSAAYQSGVSALDYEIIAIDNGSVCPLNPDRVGELGRNIKYHYFDTDSVSPVDAINYGVSIAEGEFVAVIVDGARMSTPGLIGRTLKALELVEQPFVCALAWHLGPDVQKKSMLEGYNQSEEDLLLDSIDWQKNGYKLFDISTIAPSSKAGFLGGMPGECSWFAMRRSHYLYMGGYDPRFQAPGGGLVNHDFLNRITQQSQISPIIILGEGLFHQIHGGVATNSKPGEHPLPSFMRDYEKIHNRPFKFIRHESPLYFGEVSTEAARFLASSIDNGYKF